jgi:hypothetical protein
MAILKPTIWPHDVSYPPVMSHILVPIDVYSSASSPTSKRWALAKVTIAVAEVRYRRG